MTLTDPTRWLLLADQCDATHGPDQRLDALIHQMVSPDKLVSISGPIELGAGYGTVQLELKHLPLGNLTVKTDRGSYGDAMAIAFLIGAPRYTGDIGTALRLYPEKPTNIPVDPRKATAAALRERFRLLSFEEREVGRAALDEMWMNIERAKLQ